MKTKSLKERVLVTHYDGTQNYLAVSFYWKQYKWGRSWQPTPYSKKLLNVCKGWERISDNSDNRLLSL